MKYWYTRSLNKPQENCPKWKNLISEGCIWHGSTYITFVSLFIYIYFVFISDVFFNQEAIYTSWRLIKPYLKHALKNVMIH